MHASSRSVKIGVAQLDLVVHLEPFVVEDSKAISTRAREPSDVAASFVFCWTGHLHQSAAALTGVFLHTEERSLYLILTADTLWNLGVRGELVAHAVYVRTGATFSVLSKASIARDL